MIKKDTPLKQVLKIGEECSKCGHCCNYGSGALTKDDLKNISKFLKINEKELKILIIVKEMNLKSQT